MEPEYPYDEFNAKALESLIQYEMNKLFERTCPECERPRVFLPDNADYICNDCREALESQRKGC